jgi:hypothetical protein
VLLGSVRSNLSFGLDSRFKNQTRFWSKLVPFFLCFPKRSKSIRVLLGSVRCNLSLGFGSGSKNQTRFWSKLVPFLYVSRRRVNKLECFWVKFGAISVSVLIQVLKIRPGSGPN